MSDDVITDETILEAFRAAREALRTREERRAALRAEAEVLAARLHAVSAELHQLDFGEPETNRLSALLYDGLR